MTSSLLNRGGRARYWVLCMPMKLEGYDCFCCAIIVGGDQLPVRLRKTQANDAMNRNKRIYEMKEGKLTSGSVGCYIENEQKESCPPLDSKLFVASADNRMLVLREEIHMIGYRWSGTKKGLRKGSEPIGPMLFLEILCWWRVSRGGRVRRVRDV